MSAAGSINTSTGQHAVDPYKTQNFEDPPLPQKIEDLAAFIAEVKFGMLTTKQSEGEYLASRCMALAAQVLLYLAHFHRTISSKKHTHNHIAGTWWH